MIPLKHALVALALLTPLMAGCISPDMLEAASQDSSDAPAPPPTRIDGMTAEATHEDKVERCDDSTGAAQYCATRTLDATGRIGVDALPVVLKATNGAVQLYESQGDAWSFHAVVKVRGATEEQARRGLDEAWTWSHEDADGHHLKAGPSETVPGLGLGLVPTGAQVVASAYQVHVPSWVLLDLQAKTTNGATVVEGLQATRIDLATTNGEIEVLAHASDVRLETTNGRIVARITPTATGTMTMHTTNGEIDLDIPETRAHGYDLDGKTTNGRVEIGLRDGDLTVDERNHAHFTTSRFDARPIQTTATLETTNGRINVND